MRESEDRQLLIRYLLEELSEGEQDRVEERYFVDDDFYTQLLVAEDELIDSYVQRELARDDQERFEQVYLNDPRLLKKVEAERDLLRQISRLSPGAGWWRRFLHALERVAGSGRNLRPGYALAGLLLVGMLCGLSAWLLFERARTRAELEQAREQWRQQESEYERQIGALREASPSPAPQATPQETPQLGSGEEREPRTRAPRGSAPGRSPEQASARRGVEVARAAPSTVAFTFPKPGLSVRRPGGAAPPTLVIPRGTGLVQLTVDLGHNEYAEYTMSLREVGGPVVWTQPVARNSPAPSADQVTVDLPATLFRCQDYILQVTAPDPAGEGEILARRQITVVNQAMRHTPPGPKLRR